MTETGSIARAVPFVITDPLKEHPNHGYNNI